MKKAFVSIYVLLILLVFGLTITFIYKENDTNYDISESLHNKKIALFEAESVLNMIVEERNAGNEVSTQDILKNFVHLSEIDISNGTPENGVKEAEGAKSINVRAKYKGTESHAILTYKEDKNKKIEIVYKRVY